MGYEYNRTLDKPVASLSCAILGSQHNWDLGGNSAKLIFVYPMKINALISSMVSAYHKNTLSKPVYNQQNKNI